MTFDGNILLAIQEYLRFPLLTPVMKCITTLGNAGIVWIALILILLAQKKTRTLGILCTVSLVAVSILDLAILKPLVARTRPYEVVEGLMLLVKKASDYSFPSGHSASSFAVAWVIYRIRRDHAGVAAVILAALIAWSRLYVGIHYPTDVIVGILTGILSAELTVRLIRNRIEDRFGPA